ncbi:MAG: bifunctional riboflavin kinase/FAD synthetase [Verrucomicrobiales bacterium]
MRVLRQIGELGSIGEAIHLAIGVFDGIHLGHQAVIHAAIDSARREGGVPVVVTFAPHPMAVLRPEAAPRLLASLAHQQKILEALGIEYLLVVEFDEGFAAQEAGQFIDQLASACQPLKQICVGAEWRFGRGRGGDVALLERMGSELGFSVTGVEPVTSTDGEVISSTLVRRAVRDGELERAKALLGRDYTVLGDVVEGRKLGRTIGFPTANLAVHSEQLPPSGVYAVRVELDDGTTLRGVANLGTRPTVDPEGAKRLLEVHLFQFDRQIYGRAMEVWFERFLRGEQKFDSVEALRKQITIDVEQAKATNG